MYNEFVAVKTESFSGVAAKSPVGHSIRSVLRRALVEKRLTIGLMPTLQYLSNNCNSALFCFTTVAIPGDSATHMQEVLLQAFCVENDIYIVKVDSVDKMRRLLGCSDARTDFSCVLVHSSFSDPFADIQQQLSNVEQDLIDHCESACGIAATSVIKLPET